MIVKNTGNVPLTFANFTDANCTNIKGGPTKALAPGESATYTCEHALTAAGTYSNQASVEGDPPAEDGLPITHSSNTVVVDIPENPEFTIEKLQRLKGEVNYTVSELKGKIGQTVEYKIVVKNTGNMPLTFTPLEDPNCEGITPSGTTELEPRQRRDVHLHPRPHRCRQIPQLGVDRSQRPDQRQIERSHRRSPVGTVLHDRKAAADQRRSQLQHG